MGGVPMNGQFVIHALFLMDEQVNRAGNSLQQAACQ
jgi:hypothetical protein